MQRYNSSVIGKKSSVSSSSASGIFSVNNIADEERSSNWPALPIPFDSNIEYLVIAGGGGGGYAGSNNSGGGGAGAGGYLTSNFTASAGTTYTITVGAGGAKGSGGSGSQGLSLIHI